MTNAYVGGIAAFRYCGASGGDTAALRLLRRGDASAAVQSATAARERKPVRSSALPRFGEAAKAAYPARSFSAIRRPGKSDSRIIGNRAVRSFPCRTVCIPLRIPYELRRSRRPHLFRSRADDFSALGSRIYFLSVRRTKISSSPACTASSPTIGYDASASARNTGFLTSSP